MKKSGRDILSGNIDVLYRVGKLTFSNKMTVNVTKHTNPTVSFSEYASANPMGDSESLVADSRYRYIERVAKKAYHRGNKAGSVERSARIDAILTHKALAIPLFLIIIIRIVPMI